MTLSLALAGSLGVSGCATTSKPVETASSTNARSTPPPTSDASDGEGDLLKASQNPVGDLISVPIETQVHFNATGGVDSDEERYVVLAKPVVPVHLSEDWNLIIRALIPYIVPPQGVSSMVDDGSGLGDINTTFFLSPAKPGKFIWGLGPSITVPSATNDALGSEKWSAGPAFVGLTMTGPWVIGVLISHVWSFAGNDDRDDVSLTTVNPIINYNLDGGWFLTSTPVWTANWEADNSDKYTVPIGGGFGKVFKIGKQPMKWALQAFYNAVRPDDSSNWSLSFTLTWLFPQKPKTGEMTTSTLMALPQKSFLSGGN